MVIRMNKQKWQSLLAYIGFGAVSGTATAAILILYKYLAERAIHLSETAYHHLQGHLWLVPAAVAGLLAVAWVLTRIYKRLPDLQGSGIPAAIASIRGLSRFSWWKTLIGTFVLSLSSFLLGVPLGNEGPAVQIGTAVGRGAARLTDKRHADWARYAMTGGACAGFAIATGAPIAGILFGMEEAHRKLTPSLATVSATAVAFATVTAKLLAPLFGVSTALFSITTPTLPLKAAWIPLCVGVALGLLAVGFLSYYRVVRHLLNKTLCRVPQFYKIGGILLLTLTAGLFSGEFLSTGHHLTLSLYEGGYAVWLLVLLLLVRTSLTLGASVSGITGGTFVPTLVLGALGAALLGNGLLAAGMDPAY